MEINLEKMGPICGHCPYCDRDIDEWLDWGLEDGRILLSDMIAAYKKMGKKITLVIED